MKLTFAFLALIASTTAKVLESDKLAKRGLENLWSDLKANPANYSTACTERTVARRREWYVGNTFDGLASDVSTGPS